MLFSGRFDPPHLGHAIIVFELLERYERVIVVMLDYPESDCSLAYRQEVLKAAFRHLGDRVLVLINQHHFGRITPDQVSVLGVKWDVYGSGNDACLKHMESLGYRTEYVTRLYELSATEVRMGRHINAFVQKGKDE